MCIGGFIGYDTMADLAEILMVEHIGIRNAEWILNPHDTERFLGFLTYMKECHIEIEEKVCFPLLENYAFPDKLNFTAKVKRIRADHKLIEKLGWDVITWNNSGEPDKETSRIPLFYKTLLDHNLEEDNDLFPRWDLLDKRETETAMKEALSIIESFGVVKWQAVTGVNEPMFRYVFKIE
jgi:hemerythrin superfamily protein